MNDVNMDQGKIREWRNVFFYLVVWTEWFGKQPDILAITCILVRTPLTQVPLSYQAFQDPNCKPQLRCY